MSALASFRKNTREEVRVSLDEFNGYDLVNIRVWYQTEDGEVRPGKQGLAIRLEQLPELQAALATVEQALGRESEAA
jgi:hypothetical protein